tara:strand:+ start:758 stop:1606 length:849 start_codon:yes stop_codon:yes gene_type:complete
MKSIKLIFSGEKCINSKILNILGIQSFRYLFSKFLYFIKFLILKRKNHLRIYQDGFDIQKEFLDKENFDNVRKEYHDVINNPKYSTKILQTNKHKESVEITSVDIDEKIKKDYPNLYNLKFNDKIRDFFINCEQKKDVKVYIHLEKIETINSLNLDSQKKYHYDTFYNTFKAWLYIDDVKLEDGPFFYIKNSHKVSLKRFIIEWIFSILFAFNKNIDASFRYGNSSKNQKTLNSIAKKFYGNKNTFIMANTHGLHRRGDSELNTIRNTIHFYSRENPFKVIK